MNTPAAIGLIIVGDEILSGRRQDQHLTAVTKILSERGLLLSWCQVIGDDFNRLVAMYQNTFASDDLVFSAGGIGATPDDLTRQAVAQALQKKLVRHPQGIEIFKQKYESHKLTDHRYRMIEFPESAELIQNPVNQVPGFSIQHHHFVPGFPEMAWPMIESVLDNQYTQLLNQQYSEIAIHVYGLHEGDLIPAMETVLKQFAGIKVFSLPSIDPRNRFVEIVVKGNAAQSHEAMDTIKEQIKAMQGQWKHIDGKH